MGSDQSKDTKNSALSSPKEENLHRKKLSSTLDALRLNKELCDVSIWCRGCEFEAHKVVLASSSPYFLQLFLTSSSEGKKDRINLDYLHPEGMNEVLQYMYTGQADVEAPNILNIMQTAQLFKMEGMYLKCRQLLIRRINFDTCLHVWDIADKLSDAYLRSAALDFATANLSELRNQSQWWPSMTLDRLRLLLTDVRVSPEKAVEAAIAWTRHVPADHQSDIGPLFRALKLESLSQSFLEKLIKNEVLMSEIPVLRSFVSAAIQSKVDVDDQTAISLWENSDDQPKTLILVFSECSGQTIMQNYCIENNTWSRSEMAPFDVRVMGTAVHENLVYCAGGKCPEDENIYMSSLYVYYPLDYQLQVLSSMSEARALLSLAPHNDGCLYAIGGYNASGYLNTVERYDIASDNWTIVAPLSEPRSGIASASVGDKLFAIGGRNDNGILSSVEYFTRTSEQWTVAQSMQLPRSHASTGVLNDKIYVVGGFWSVQDLVKTSLGSIQYYSTEEDTWRLATSSISSSVMITAALVWQEIIYVLTAAGKLYAFDSKEEKVRELRRAPGAKGIMRAAFIIEKKGNAS